jgi:hypothetical protein
MLMFGVVPPLDARGLDAVTEVIVPLLVAAIVWFGQVPVIVTFDPATRLGVDVPLPPFATGNVPVTCEVRLMVPDRALVGILVLAVTALLPFAYR